MFENFAWFFILICCTNAEEVLHSIASGPQQAFKLPLLRYKRESTHKSDGCLIPNHPPHGEYYQIGENKDRVPGEYAPVFTVLFVNCTPPYKPNRPLNGIQSYCVFGEWAPNPPSCASSCKSLTSTPTTKVSCKHLDQSLDDCNNPVHGTIASVECEPFHEMSSNDKLNIACKDGSWEYPLPECVPVCGDKRVKGTPNIVGPTIAKKSNYPWHVAVFNAKDDNICGGSIISRRVVLSAARCFTDEHGKLYPFENYKIVAGKYHRMYNDSRDDGAQESAIHHIYIPERYKAAENNYEADLAVIVLKEKLNASSDVQPVCVDWENQFEQQQIIENNIGIVVGWGQAMQLQETQVSYTLYPDCYEQIRVEYRKFLTFDKICTTDLSRQHSEVCRSDSGGGLTFQRNQNRFYIRGILSTPPSSKETVLCDQDQYATYTTISKYINFIRRFENQ